ncbi:MAG: helix-turn-helix domain-containing protein [Mangrovibacterium sp.]
MSVSTVAGTTNYTCLVLIKEGLFYKIRPYLDNMEVIVKQRSNELLPILRTRMIHCGVLYTEKPDQFDTCRIVRFKQKFPTIPVLAVLEGKWVETAHEYGKAGIEKVMHLSEIDRLSEEVTRLIHQYAVKITLKDIGITRLNYSKNLNEALHILERDYLTLMGVKEIADLLEINECTLSREFKKYDLPGPKRVLMYLKVHHAVKLMENKGLNRQEVALLSGFSDERRMVECLDKIHLDKTSEHISNTNV